MEAKSQFGALLVLEGKIPQNYENHFSYPELEVTGPIIRNTVINFEPLHLASGFYLPTP